MSELLDHNQPMFWVLVAFLLFMALLIWKRVPSLVGQMLDERSDAIRKELEEARRLRTDAEALLADYKKKAREAEAEAQAIIDQAKRDAEMTAAEARKSLSESIDRRSKQAEEKIARAEAQALSEVRGAAVSTALAVAEKMIRERVAGHTGSGLIEQSISELKGKLN